MDNIIDEDNASSVVGCDPYLCHYLRVNKIVKKIVRKIKIIRTGATNDVK